MPRAAQPWYRKFDDCWYLNTKLKGKRVQLRLAKGKKNRAAAFRRFHEIMATKPAAGPVVRPLGVPGAVLDLLDAFLVHARTNLAESTFKWHKSFLDDFAGFLEDGMLAEQLKIHHFTEWLDSHESWGESSKSAATRSVRTAFNWAVAQELIPGHSICKLTATEPPCRETILDQAEFDKLLEYFQDPDFREALKFVWETGARPQELRLIEARHCQIQEGFSRIVLPPSKSKGRAGKKRKPRVIYLNAIAREIVRAYCSKHPEGPIFRNKNGPWNKDKIRQKFRRYALKTGKKFCLYNLRHSWATEALTSDVDATTVGVLMGHANPSMVNKTYQHLAKKTAHLQQAVDQVRN